MENPSVSRINGAVKISSTGRTKAFRMPRSKAAQRIALLPAQSAAALVPFVSVRPRKLFKRSKSPRSVLRIAWSEKRLAGDEAARLFALLIRAAFCQGQSRFATSRSTRLQQFGSTFIREGLPMVKVRLEYP